MDEKYIILKQKNNIAILFFNRPQKHNALNHQTLIELVQYLNDLKDNKDIKGIIFTGTGEKAFISGADINEFIGFTPQKGRELSTTGQNILNVIESYPKPIIAAVNGYALGGGCELAMACHLRVASPNAIFGQPEVKLGIIPGYGGTQRLIHYLGKSKALEFLLTGNSFDAKNALSFGLINYIFPQDQLLLKSEEILNKIIRNSPTAIEGIINSVNAHFNSSSGYKQEIEEFEKCFTVNDFKEGVSAFLEKRTPHF